MTHSKRKLLAVAATVAIAATAAGCGSSKSSTSTGGSGSGGSGKSITVGVLADLSGLAEANSATVVKGIEAGIHRAASEGYNIKYVTADTQSSPSGALAAAQKLVEQDHVPLVIAESSLTFEAAPFLAQHHVPVIGVAEDGPEWTTDDNMFSITGALHDNMVATTYGDFYKLEGATNIGVLGYGISPVSKEEAKGTAASVEAAGLRVGYLNADFAYGSTNVEPVALAMKSAGVNGTASTVESSTAFALIAALRQAGVDLKVPMLATGYGADLYAGGKSVLQEAQNVYFQVGFEPMEMHTAATKQLASDLATVGVTTDPSYAEYDGYAEIALLVQALQAAGSDWTSASLQKALSGIHSFDAWGLWGGRSLDINDRSNIVIGVDNCIWMTKYVGSSFQLVPKADPICGTVVPGKTV